MFRSQEVANMFRFTCLLLQELCEYLGDCQEGFMQTTSCLHWQICKQWLSREISCHQHSNLAENDFLLPKDSAKRFTIMLQQSWGTWKQWLDHGWEQCPISCYKSNPSCLLASLQQQGGSNHFQLWISNNIVQDSLVQVIVKWWLELTHKYCSIHQNSHRIILYNPERFNINSLLLSNKVQPKYKVLILIVVVSFCVEGFSTRLSPDNINEVVIKYWLICKK